MDSPPPRLRARADGLLEADVLPDWPVMTGGLHGDLSGDGLLALGRWGVGEVGQVQIGGMKGPFVVAPGRIVGAEGSAIVAAQSAPVILLRGASPDHARHGPAGCLAVEPRGDDWLVAVGADRAEAAKGLAIDPAQVVQEAEAHVRRCDQTPAADPLLRSLVIQGVHAALSSARCYPDGSFAGLAAGLGYSTPARTYYRDGYWTMPLLLRLAPLVVAEQIELIAGHVQADGEAPSGVIVQGPHADAFEQRRLEELALAAIHWRAGDWWSDHFDSPLLFVLAVGDYVATTGDEAMARRHWPKLRAVFERYQALSGPDGLPMKPYNDRDWADNVFRSGLVAYDLGLWIGALDALARLGDRLDPQLAEWARAAAARGRSAIDRALWRGQWYADYVRPDGSAEEHLSLDALMLLRHDAAPEPRAGLMLDAINDRLESRHNLSQPYGDFGMLCVYPTFARTEELRGKSAYPYRYHNGGDWPWLDAVYAGERLRRGLSGWRYPLTRWWAWCLEQGWAGAVEDFSPAYGRGSLLQAWSSLAAAVAVAYADRVLAADPHDA